MNSDKRTARTAGLWYLALAVVGSFNLIYIPSKIFVQGNAEATVNNILANEMLFRFGIAVDFISQIVFMITAMFLYRLLKEVNLFQARLMVVIVFTSVVISIPFELINIAVLGILNGSVYSAAFSQSQLHALAMFFINLNYQWSVSYLGNLFFGLWLFPFGYLVYKSKFIPKIFGILLLINGFSYVLNSLVYILLPGNSDVISKITLAPMIIGEFSIILWLLIVGVRKKSE